MPWACGETVQWKDWSIGRNNKWCNKKPKLTQAEVLDLKNEIWETRKSASDNKAKVQEYDWKIEDLEQRFNYQEDYCRRNNLHISDLEEPEGGETWEQSATLVIEFLKNKLQLPTMDL